MLETKSIAALAFNETPRKRKRETGFVPPLKKDDAAAAAAVAVTASCFTNAAFSSTPKKLIGRRRLAKETENINPFGNHPGLEIKSIADLATSQKQQQQQQEKQLTLNPFEVVRHPSKKKKRSEHACFENPGLNLELPERQFNPYEVVRCVATPTKCFVNEALNLRGSDAPASLNPFEIHRRSEISAAASNPAGVTNPALTEEPLPTSLKIGLPFAPTLGCRIDFNGMELANLTPSKLFAEKLVFSPVTPLSPLKTGVGKRSLDDISEESTMDIGKELDRYQLELENSINEAKLRKNGIVEEVKQVEEMKLVEQLDRRIICTTRRRTLTEIIEEVTEETAEVETGEEKETKETVEEIVKSGDVAYASESETEELEDELDFKAPARFVRAYRPAATVAPIKASSIAGSKESLQSIASSKSAKSVESVKGHSVRNMLRKSIRKLMHPMQQEEKEREKEKEQEKQPEQEKHHGNIISSIRHSLRRRPKKEEQEPEQETAPRPADISIIDSSERTMKLRSNVIQTEYMRIEQLTNEKKHTLRNSIRRSTRDVLRHVFHKSQDAYATAK
ncbi:inner centromere protein [Drosophila innubila]|uniref:inner centromere protein n=1 Tax=Drosophila innubila TaxID=198719 RepID=UPI00148B88D0|nr:inner centromere protein [Drosophila innubila]